MSDVYYTLACWKVKLDQEQEFIAAWKGLAKIFDRLANKPISGTLLQSTADPTLFYSFGPWKNLADIEAMRKDPESRDGLQQLMSLCSEATPGSYKLAAQINM